MKLGEQQIKDHQQTGHQEIVHMGFQQGLVVGKQPFHKGRGTDTGQAPRKYQRNGQAETSGSNQDGGMVIHNRLLSSRRKERRASPGPVEGRWLTAKCAARYLHLADLAIAGGGAVALIPAVAAFSLAGGLCVLATTLAGRARAGCALALFRFHRHWNLLFALSLVAFSHANNWSVALGPPSGIV
jgi:hypothetical protein